YNWVALAFDGTSSLVGYMGWTDNRDVRPGVDIRETDYVDGFDVFQCRTPTALEPDQCPNAHGLDQNIYGQSLTLPVGCVPADSGTASRRSPRTPDPAAASAICEEA